MLPFQFLLSPCHHLRDEAKRRPAQDLMAAAAEELRFLGRGGYTRPLTLLPRLTDHSSSRPLLAKVLLSPQDEQQSHVTVNKSNKSQIDRFHGTYVFEKRSPLLLLLLFFGCYPTHHPPPQENNFFCPNQRLLLFIPATRVVCCMFRFECVRSIETPLTRQ